MSENKKLLSSLKLLILINGAIIKWNNDTLDMDFLNPFGWENNIVPSNDDDAIIDINDILVVGLENEIHINSLLLESNSRMTSIQPFTTKDNITIGINSYLLSKFTKARLISNYGKFNGGHYPNSSLLDTTINSFGNAQVNFINSSEMVTIVESPSNFYQTSQMVIGNSNAYFFNTSSINLYDQSKTNYYSSTIRHLSFSHINLYNNSQFSIDNSTLLIKNGNQFNFNDQSIFLTLNSEIIIQSNNSILKISSSSLNLNQQQQQQKQVNSTSTTSFKNDDNDDVVFNQTNLYSTDGGEILINRNSNFLNSILISNGLNSKTTIFDSDYSIIKLSIIYSNDNGEINIGNNLNTIINDSIIVTQDGGKINLFKTIIAHNVSIEISTSQSHLNLKPSSKMNLNGGSKIKVSNGANFFLSENSLLNLTNSELLIDKNGSFFQNGPIYLISNNKFENRFKFHISSNILTTLPISSTSSISSSTTTFSSTTTTSTTTTSTTATSTPKTTSTSSTSSTSKFYNNLINNGIVFIKNLNQKILINTPIINNGTIMVESNCFFSNYHQNSNNSILVIKSDSTIDSNENIHLKAGKIYGTGRINTSIIHDYGELGSRNETGILNITGDYTLSSNGLVVIFINSLSDYTQIRINETAILKGDIEIIISNKISTSKLIQLDVVNYHDLDKYSITFRKVRFKTFNPETGLEINGHDCARSISTDRSFSVVLIDCQSPISTGVIIAIVCGIVFIVIVVASTYHFKKSISKRLKNSSIVIKLKKTKTNNNQKNEEEEEEEDNKNDNKEDEIENVNQIEIIEIIEIIENNNNNNSNNNNNNNNEINNVNN
ncbi:hypothetical protein ACTA71_001673 [Dictyostelium dimigraforme]